MTHTTGPDTVVLVHGLWMTPRSWEHWIPYYQERGLTVLTPAYPGFEIEVEALRENPDVIANLTVAETLDHLTDVVRRLPNPPIIIGHSFGGTLTQLLLARGVGCAGVAIDSAPTEGVRATPATQVKSLFPALKNPANRHRAVGFTPEEFHYAFTNTLTEAQSRAVWDRYHIPAPGYWVFEYGLIANFKPGHQDTWVDYQADRAPLLFIAGTEDHLMPPAVNRSNAKQYGRSPAITEYHEFAGRDHWTCGGPGWEEVADHALDWATRNARFPHPA
ncbi:alpha/beta hydrolase [Micromonospora radicis]|uniref:Alpha/beta fold hydrolase n=1 Tax=Micromonospora radicis TaxID=1894971 RepID=A0A418MNQ7_9ACTN|nr:alpha/beta fold hydrolase [Micromonospora radicis]RIV32724.1 alpha/beta fold hydrolase [Micromonospora radicis]